MRFYYRYGGRGITVCEEWHDFLCFADWALAHGWERGLHIDRVDNNGPYTPDNCRFVTPLANNQNREQAYKVEAFGEVKSLNGWVRDERCHIVRSTLWTRLAKGVDPETAITSPPAPHRNTKAYK